MPTDIRIYRANTYDADKWYRKLSADGQARTNAVLDALELQEPQAWARPRVDSLAGPCKGLKEIRLKIGKTQCRLIGFLGPGAKQFTVLMISKEKGGKFDPAKTCEIGQDRKTKSIENTRFSQKWVRHEH